MRQLQQYLPFTVLKRLDTILYVFNKLKLQQYLPFTVLKLLTTSLDTAGATSVATVLTVYGIETKISAWADISGELQQYLPFTVLKQTGEIISITFEA